jgi:hypothetical protein
MGLVGRWDNRDPGHYHACVRACSSAGQSASLTTTNQGLISLRRGPAETAFVQVNAKYSVSSK